MSSHVNPKVNDKFKEWMIRNYGKYGEFKANRGKLRVGIKMDGFVEKIFNEFPMKIGNIDMDLTPNGNNIFENI